MNENANKLHGLGVLIVDDEADVCLGLTKLISALGANVQTAPDGIRALEIVRRGEISLVISDIRMPHMTGIELLDAIRREDLKVEVLLMTGFGTIELAVDCMSRGAAHFIGKPFDNREMQRVACSIGENLMRRQPPQTTASKFIAKDGRMQNLLKEIKQVAATLLPVLIEGETGTGKELVAREVHRLSPVATRTFRAVNCAALPDTLLESELFGHKKGAFTGADCDRQGLFELAAGGTVFLDEVASMSSAFQGKLLRILQEKMVRPLGGAEDVPVNFRLVAATNRELETLVELGQFRSDLLYRLRVLHLRIPPLRERPDDILALTEYFVERYAADCRFEQTQAPKISAELEQFLGSHAWPGNIRELEHAVMRALVACRGPELERDHFDIVPVEVDGLNYDEGKRKAIALFQRRFVVDLLKSYHGNVSRAAGACGLTRAALQKIMRSLDIRRERYTSEN